MKKYINIISGKLNIPVWAKIIKECILGKLIIPNLITEVMAKYLVEVYHSADKIECLRTIQIFLSTGSHFLTHADWGCLDGEHKAWFILDIGSKEDAKSIVPPAFRQHTRIIGLTKFNINKIDELKPLHKA